MSRYFDNFSIINYNGSLGFNITERTAILNSVFGNRYSFYPYVVKNGMRAEQVAEKYYGNSDLVWLVYFSNNIIDPYYEWTMDEQTFERYIIEKYGSRSIAVNKILKYRVNWYEDTRVITKSHYNSLDETLKKYWTPNFDGNNYAVSYVRKELDFYNVAINEDGDVELAVPEIEQEYWTEMTAYDYEEEQNSKKAHIKLLDKRLTSIAVANIKELLGT